METSLRGASVHCKNANSRLEEPSAFRGSSNSWSRIVALGVFMSMELWVFSDKQLSSIAQWQAAIDVEAYPLKLDDSTVFEALDGFLPARLRGQPAGFECYHDDAAKLMHNNPDIKFDHHWEYVLALRWVGSKVVEQRAAWMAGTAYAQATDGVVFDDQEGKFRNAREARDVVRDVDRAAPEIDHKAMVDKVLRDLKLGPYRE
jgi:hypothetical protein